jgi:glycosyltransferase involved in cell wall biosynthesis
MHILFLTDNFPPEVNAPASRTFDHCKAWVEEGAEVTVVTCAPNFPTGKVHDGYRNRLYQVEYMAGIKVIRVWTIISSNEGFLTRIIDYLSFMVAGVLAALTVRRVDLIIGTSPQFFTICAARIVALIKRRPWVLELRDIWPESILAVGAMKRGLAFRILEAIERSLYRAADHIVVVAHSFVDLIVAKGAPRDRISVITNGVDLSGAQRVDASALRSSLGLDGKFVAGYIGTHGMAHALETLLEAALLLQANPEHKDVRIMFVGDGARKAYLQDYAEQLGLSNVIFVASVPKTEVLTYLSALDVSIVHLKGSDLFEAVIPSKIFESMALGIPIMMGVRGEALAIVKTAEAGVGFEPENAAALAAAIGSARSDIAAHAAMRDAGLRAAKCYDRSRLALEMLTALKKVTQKQ